MPDPCSRSRVTGMTSCRALVDVLTDQSARWDERDDAALDLANHAVPEAIDALSRVADDPREDETLRETCRDSLAEIDGRAEA